MAPRPVQTAHLPFGNRRSMFFTLLEHPNIQRVKAVGLRGGGITLLHMATQQPQGVEAMVPISAPPYFPAQVRAIQRQYSTSIISETEMTRIGERHKGGERQIEWIIAQTRAMARSCDDVNFTPPLLGTITARTLIVLGEMDPLYWVRLAFELRDAIPRSSLWVVPGSGHGPVFGKNGRISSPQQSPFGAATGPKSSSDCSDHGGHKDRPRS